MKTPVLRLAALLLSGLCAAPAFAQLPRPDDRTVDIALIGDIPYSGLQVAQYPNVIAAINESKVDFTVHIGDIKAGDTLCNDAAYTTVRDSFNTFRSALIYTPGDNEWTDCHRISPNNGGYNPLERLAFVREVFFPTDWSWGQKPLRLEHQSDSPEFAVYRENTMWSAGVALFATINMVGSNNALDQTSSCVPANPVTCPNPFAAAMNEEYSARNAANLAWIRRAFQVAREQGFGAVMILAQANPNMDRRTNDPNRTGFNDTISVLRSEAVAFGKPVVLVHGDSHYVRIDKPLTDLDPVTSGTLNGRRIENFTRVEVFGSPDAHWIKATVDPHNPEVFTFELKTVSANVLPR